MSTGQDSDKPSTTIFAPPGAAGSTGRGSAASRFNESVLTKLGTLLTRTLDDLASIEVKTYTSSNNDAALADVDDPLAQNMRLRAFSRVALDGDTEHCVPLRDGEIDRALWEVHLGMVQQAQEHRDRTLSTIVAAVKALTRGPA